jgi:hypothetical protein
VPHSIEKGNEQKVAVERAFTPDKAAKKLSKRARTPYLNIVTTVKEIEAAIPRLSRAEVEELRGWIDNFLEDQLELTDEVKAKLDQSRREIAAGNYTTRQPK